MSETKVAFIAGAASRGIGFATAKRFLADGWACMLFDRNEATAAQRMEELSAEERGRTEFVFGDITVQADIERALDRCLEKHGRVDAVYNGAGWMGGMSAAADTDFEEAAQVIEVNLTGALMLSVVFAKRMAVQGGGTIVNTSSIAAQLAGSGPVAYSVAKAGVELLTKFLAKDFSRYGVRFVTVAPGWVETDIDRETLKLPGMRPMAEKLHASKRIMQPEETAEVVFFLCQPAARVINGSTVNVDDGFSGFKEGEVVLV